MEFFKNLICWPFSSIVQAASDAGTYVRIAKSRRDAIFFIVLIGDLEFLVLEAKIEIVKRG